LSDNAPPGRITFSEKFACPVSGFTIAEIEPRLFSFNAPQGACPACDGLGEKLYFDPDLVVPNQNLSIKKGAVVPWAKSNPPSPYYMQVLSSLAREFDFSLETPWNELPEDVHQVILHGTKGKPVTLRFIDGRKSYEVKKPFEGVIGNLNAGCSRPRAPGCARSSPNTKRRPLRDLQRRPPPPEPLAIKIAGEDISISTRRSVVQALEWFSTLEEKLAPAARDRPAILKEINERLGFLNNVGLDYLNLDRTSGTLSGGESQRIRLGLQIGSASRRASTSSTSPRSAFTSATTTACSSRCAACAISATPSSSSSMTRIPSATPTTSSTWAPGAGVHGGEVVAQGKLEDVLANENSLTADYLTGRRSVAVPSHAPQRQWPQAQGARRPRQQFARCHHLHPARHVHLHHRRLRLRQVQLHHRHPLRRRRPPAERRPSPLRPRARRSTASNIWTR
jgi:excinuclease ABC subunit A